MGLVIAAVAIHIGVWVMLFTLARFEPPPRSAPIRGRHG